MIRPLWVLLPHFFLSTLLNGKGDVEELILAWIHVVPVTMLLAVSFPPYMGRIRMTCGLPFLISRLNAQCGTVL